MNCVKPAVFEPLPVLPDQASDTLQIEVIGSVRGVRRALVVAKYGEHWKNFERGQTQLQLEDDTFVYECDLQYFLTLYPHRTRWE